MVCERLAEGFGAASGRPRSFGRSVTANVDAADVYVLRLNVVEPDARPALPIYRVGLGKPF
jgi:hypothetical protein